MDKAAKYNVGTLVVHKRQGYRAVVIDVDSLFQASGQYNPRAHKKNFAVRNPWYRLLVDGSDLITYVEENLLKLDRSKESIRNPQINNYLVHRKGAYYSKIRSH